MKSLNKNNIFRKFSFFVLVIISCLFISTSTVQASESDINQAYNFTLRAGFKPANNSPSTICDAWRTQTYQGGDIDFFTIHVVCKSGSKILSRYYIYALSYTEFYFNEHWWQKNNRGELIDRGVTYSNLKANHNVDNDYYFLSWQNNADFDSKEDYLNYPGSGYPNVIECINYDMTEDEIKFFVNEIYQSQIDKFLDNGGLDWEDKLDQPSSGGTYDENLPIITTLTYKSLTPIDCHSIATLNGCFNLTWKVPEGALKDDVLEIRASCNYNYSTMRSTKRLSDSGFFDFSKIYGYIPITRASDNFCVTDFIPSLNIDDINGFTLLPQKIYIRIIRNISSDPTYGDWVIYDVERDILNTPEIGKGEVIPGDSEFDDLGGYIEKPKSTIDPPESDNGSFSFDFSNVSSVLSMFRNIIESLISALGMFPLMFSTIFSFLPAPIANAFYLVLIVSIVVGILKIFT